MKPKPTSVVAVIVVLLLASGVACGNDGDDSLKTPATGLEMSTPQATDGQAAPVVFPRHDAPLGTDRGGEYFAGQLVISEGCVRAEAPSNDATNPWSSFLLIWPGAFTIEADSRSVRIVDGLGRIAAHAGDHVRLSRAAVTYQEAMDQGLIEGLSEDCEGPYLLVGDEVTAFDPNSEATELRLSGPDVLLLRERTVKGFPARMQALGIGELVLDGPCLRLGDSSTTIIWPAGFTPHVDRGVVQVRNGAGLVIATVGDEIAAGGGYRSLDDGACSGKVFIANQIKVLPDADVYFPRQDGTLTEDQEAERYSGELVLDGKCLNVDSPLRLRDRTYGPVSFLLIWPSAFSLSVEDGEVGVVDATGRIVARVGDEVIFSAFDLSYQQAMEHGGLEEISPACSGALWAVGEEFSALAPENPGEATSDVAEAWTVEQAEALAEQIVGFFIRNKPTVRSEYRGVLTEWVRDNVVWIWDGPQREGDDVQKEVTAHVWLEVEGRTYEVWVPFILTIREQSVVDWTINFARARVHE